MKKVKVYKNVDGKYWLVALCKFSNSDVEAMRKYEAYYNTKSTFEGEYNCIETNED